MKCLSVIASVLRAPPGDEADRAIDKQGDGEEREADRVTERVFRSGGGLGDALFCADFRRFVARGEGTGWIARVSRETVLASFGVKAVGARRIRRLLAREGSHRKRQNEEHSKTV